MPNRIFIAKLIALGAAVVSIQQAAAGALDWEIERNFRYFKFSPDIAVHRIAFDLFKAEFKKTPSIDGLERYINGPGFWKKNLVSADAERNSWPKAWRANNLKTPYALIAKLRGLENDRAAVPDASELERLGWASLLVRAQDKSHPNGQTDTCWSTIRRQHTNCTEYGDYVRPQGWVVQRSHKSPTR